MKTADYSEDALIEQPAIELFGKLRWETANCFHEFDHGPSPLGRDSKGEVVLVPQVKKVVKDLIQRLKTEKFVLDWRKRQQSRAAVRVCIGEILDQLPRVYTPEVYQ